MATYRRVYDSRHLQADCQEPGANLDQLRNPTLGNRVWATFFISETTSGRDVVEGVRLGSHHDLVADDREAVDVSSLSAATRRVVLA